MSNVQTRRRRNLRVDYLRIPHRLMSGNQGHSCVCKSSVIWLGFRSWSCCGYWDKGVLVLSPPPDVLFQLFNVLNVFFRRRKLARSLSLDPAEIDEQQSRAIVRLWVLYDMAWLPLSKLLWLRRYLRMNLPPPSDVFFRVNVQWDFSS